MSKIFTIFLIFALLSFAPSPLCNRALSFYYSLCIGKMVESFRRVYVNAPIKTQAKYKVVMLWNHTVVSNHTVVFNKKGLRRGKCRLVKLS